MTSCATAYRTSRPWVKWLFASKGRRGHSGNHFDAGRTSVGARWAARRVRQHEVDLFDDIGSHIDLFLGCRPYGFELRADLELSRRYAIDPVVPRAVGDRVEWLSQDEHNLAHEGLDFISQHVVPRPRRVELYSVAVQGRGRDHDGGTLGAGEHGRERDLGSVGDLEALPERHRDRALRVTAVGTDDHPLRVAFRGNEEIRIARYDDNRVANGPE